MNGYELSMKTRSTFQMLVLDRVVILKIYAHNVYQYLQSNVGKFLLVNRKCLKEDIFDEATLWKASIMFP